MKPVILACTALLGLSVLTTALPGEALAQTQPAVAPATVIPPPAPATAPAISARQVQPAPSKLRGPPPPRAGERRRPSYASCNREAHRRNLHGGARRRYLIRCKLGYDRPRQSTTSQPQPAPAPARQP